jgi:hypothetical protein
MRLGPRDPKDPHLGLLTLSVIVFDSDHSHAIVNYDFNCGGLCGHGKMLALAKSGEQWKISKSCEAGSIEDIVQSRASCVIIIN